MLQSLTRVRFVQLHGLCFLIKLLNSSGLWFGKTVIGLTVNSVLRYIHLFVCRLKVAEWKFNFLFLHSLHLYNWLQEITIKYSKSNLYFNTFNLFVIHPIKKGYLKTDLGDWSNDKSLNTFHSKRPVQASENMQSTIKWKFEAIRVEPCDNIL